MIKSEDMLPQRYMLQQTIFSVLLRYIKGEYHHTPYRAYLYNIASLASNIDIMNSLSFGIIWTGFENEWMRSILECSTKLSSVDCQSQSSHISSNIYVGILLNGGDYSSLSKIINILLLV